MKITTLTLSVLCSAVAFADSTRLNPVVPFLAITGRPTESDVAAKVAALKADGFDQFLVYARSGLQYRYMGEEWLRTVEACCREGQKRNMKVWLYDEFNWPSGTCKGRVPAADERFRYSEWAVYPKADGGYRWEVVKAPAGWVNVCEPDAIRLFIQMTHEVYAKRLAKYFEAKVIPGIFSDEPGHPTGVAVGKDCLVHFRRWIGMEDEYRAETKRDFRTDVEKFLTARKARPHAANAEVWAIYWRLMGRRFRAAYFDQIRAWCDKMGIVLTGHLISESSITDSLTYNGDPLLALKGESLPGMDEIFSNAAWGNGVGWDGGTEWLTFATMQHAAYRVKRGGLVELYACGPNDMSAARMRQMIWMCALHGVDHYLTSMQIMDHRGLVEKHGYLSPMQNGQPWHCELKPLFDDAKVAARLARRQDVIRHAAVRQPLSLAADAVYNQVREPPVRQLLGAFDGGQLSVDLIGEDEPCDLPYVFEVLANGGYRETRTGKSFAGANASAKAAEWLRAQTPKAARFFETNGEPALGLVVREWADGTVAAIDIKNSGRRSLTLVANGKREKAEFESRGIFVTGHTRPSPVVTGRIALPPALTYSLDRDVVFRLPFATNRIATFTVKEPLKGVRLALRTCAMSYAVTASGRPVDDGEGEPPDEQVLRHVATPYSFELDGQPVIPTRPCTSLPVEFRPLYGETEPLELAPGVHTVRIVTGEADVNYFLPAAFAVGAFAENHGALTRLPAKLSPGALAKQGLAGFCGVITYTLEGVKRPQGDTLALNVGNAFARVKWNGVDLGTRAWAPFVWQLPDDGQPTGKLEVTVYTHVWNIFGDHDRPDAKWDMGFWIPQHDADIAPGLHR